jgi:hypothetical protein
MENIEKRKIETKKQLNEVIPVWWANNYRV